MIWLTLVEMIQICFFFADGAKIFQYVNDIVDVSTLQCTLDKFIEWADKWLVKLNVSKKIMSFCRKGQIDNMILILVCSCIYVQTT